MGNVCSRQGAAHLLATQQVLTAGNTNINHSCFQRCSINSKLKLLHDIYFWCFSLILNEHFPYVFMNFSVQPILQTIMKNNLIFIQTNSPCYIFIHMLDTWMKISETAVLILSTKYIAYVWIRAVLWGVKRNLFHPDDDKNGVLSNHIYNSFSFTYFCYLQTLNMFYKPDLSVFVIRTDRLITDCKCPPWCKNKFFRLKTKDNAYSTNLGENYSCYS